MKTKKITVFLIVISLCFTSLSGCSKQDKGHNDKHTPLTIMTTNVNYSNFKALLHETYPEIQLDFISYTGGNSTGYSQYLLDNEKTPDIFTISVFSTPEQQKKSLLDISGYEFLNNYKTADINQVTIDGALYLVPASSSIIGLYYNKTLFNKQGWKVPSSFDELMKLTETIRTTGIDPVAAQFEYPGSGFFDLFTFAKTGFLSTPDGLQWERDFQTGKAGAKDGLDTAAVQMQTLLDYGFLDAEDTTRTFEECKNHFYNGEAAMYLNAGNLPRFTQNEDGSGDQYGIMPFWGIKSDDSILITKPLCYFGLSKTLSESGNEQKLEDALNVMKLLATEKGQQSLITRAGNYITPLKNSEISKESPFYEVKDLIRTGHTSTLAYAGYEPIMIGVGEKIREWVAGKASGNEVLALADKLQKEYLNGDLPPIAAATEDFSLEESAQLQAEAFRQAADTDIGLVSIGGIHDGIENPSGVCGALFKGNITEMVVNAIPPAVFGEPLCILTLRGSDIKSMLDTGFVVDSRIEGFPYIPAGITVTKTEDGSISRITFPDGSDLSDSTEYTVAIDQGGFTEQIGEKGGVQVTKFIITDILTKYLQKHSPVSPLKHSIIQQGRN